MKLPVSILLMALIAVAGCTGSRGIQQAQRWPSYHPVGYWTEAGGRTLNNPYGIAVDSRNGNVLVTDAENHRVVIFDGSGRFLLVADAYNYRVQVYNPEGESLSAHGRQVRRSHGRIERFDQVYGAAFGPEGKLNHLVDGGANPGHQRVVLLNEQGRFLTSWSLPDAGHVNTPMQIALSPDGRHAYATDIAGDRIIVLAVD